MNIEKKKITDKIFLLTFDNQLDITSTFLRFQEYYESPEFAGKIFTLEEYKKWYASIKGSFSYYTDWSGFNIPSYILKPFCEGKFDPLSDKEKQLLDMFNNESGEFYIIGIHEKVKNADNLLRHEIAHGLFYTVPEYKAEILTLLKSFDLEEIKKELRAKAGYNEEVMDDEVHAYVMDNAGTLKAKIPQVLSRQLGEIYDKYIHSKPINIISERAAAFIVEDGRILLMRRKKNGREYYCIPGGQVEEGETPEEAAQREVKEETNLDVKTEKLLLTFEREIYDDGEVALYHEKSGGLVREYFFLAEDITGEEKLGGPELERQSERNFYQLQWIKLADVDKIELLPARAKEALASLDI